MGSPARDHRATFQRPLTTTNHQTSKAVSWGWALVFVAALHLATATGSWTIADHADMILMSHRLIERGTFTLAPEGQVAPELRWGPTGRPRFFPGPAVAYAPLVLADRLLGWGRPPELGVLVHFGSHIYVLGALGLLGCAARRAGARPLAAAMLVLLCGTSWPVWQIVRSGGAEPVVAFWVALFLWGSVARSKVAKAVACLALPWTHPTGCLLAPTLALCQHVAPATEPAAESRIGLRRERVLLMIVALSSVGSVILIWNLLYHGDWWGGGYGNHARSLWFAQPPLRVWAGNYLVQWVLYVPVLMMLCGATLTLGWRGLRLILAPMAVFLVISVFFSVYTPTLGQDYIRRLSVVWPGFGLAVALAWKGLGLDPRVAGGLAALNLIIGVYWFYLIDFSYYRLPDETYYPLVLWITWMLEGRPVLLWGGYLLACGLAAALAAHHLRPLFAGSAKPKGAPEGRDEARGPHEA